MFNPYKFHKLKKKKIEKINNNCLQCVYLEFHIIKKAFGVLNIRITFLEFKDYKASSNMERFHIEGDEFIPEIDLDPESSTLRISGESYHEYTGEFFEPIFEWIEEFIKTPGRDVHLKFRMDYFNTASSKCFYDIIEMLNTYQQSGGGNLRISWFYEDNDLDMLESGEDYAEDSGVNIEFIPYPKGTLPY